MVFVKPGSYVSIRPDQTPCKQPGPHKLWPDLQTLPLQPYTGNAVSGQMWIRIEDAILVWVSVAEKRYHDRGKSYKGRHFIEVAVYS